MPSTASTAAISVADSSRTCGDERSSDAATISIIFATTIDPAPFPQTIMPSAMAATAFSAQPRSAFHASTVTVAFSSIAVVVITVAVTAPTVADATIAITAYTVAHAAIIDAAAVSSAASTPTSGTAVATAAATTEATAPLPSVAIAATSIGVAVPTTSTAIAVHPDVRKETQPAVHPSAQPATKAGRVHVW